MVRTRALAPSLLLVALVLAPGAARAQTTPGGPVMFNTTNYPLRQGSPRASEMLYASGLSPNTPIGLRDCSCETWTFSIQTGQFSWASTLELWVGEDTASCTNSTTRYPSATPTCWQIPSTPQYPTTFYPAQSNFNYIVTIPSILLLNPRDVTCTALNGQPSGTEYLFVLARGSSTDTMGTPSDTFQINFILEPPAAPTGVGAAPQDMGAQVNWTAQGTFNLGDEAGTESGLVTTTTAPTLFGYYVLAFGSPLPVFDAGTTGVCDSAVQLGDIAVGNDVIEDDAVDDFGFVDESGDAAVSDSDAGDAATDVADGTNTDGASGGTCDLPAGFDPNDDTQFHLYQQSGLLSPSTASYVVTGLSNDGGVYAFAVVAEDTAGNRSVSSLTPCVTPQPVTSFWDHYRASGGQAQSGVFCAVRPGHFGRFGVVGGAIAAMVAGIWVRRRRRARRGGRA